MQYFLDPNVAISGGGTSYADAFQTLADANVGVTTNSNSLLCKGHAGALNSETINATPVTLATNFRKIGSVSGGVRPGFGGNPKEMFTFAFTGDVGAGISYVDVQNGMTLKNLLFTFWSIIVPGLDYACCIDSTGAFPLLIDYCSIDCREPSVPLVRCSNANGGLTIKNSAIMQGGVFAGTGTLIPSNGGLDIDNCLIWLPHGKLLASVGGMGTIKNSMIIVGFNSGAGQTSVDFNWITPGVSIQCINNIYLGFDMAGGVGIIVPGAEELPIGATFKDPTPRTTLDPEYAAILAEILAKPSGGVTYRPTIGPY